MEEETRKKFPSLPPNFVSLSMLKERREQEQKQKEEEEQRRLEEQKVREEEEEGKERLRNEEEGKKIQRSPRVRNGAGIGAKTSSIRYNRKNHRNSERQRDRKKEQDDSELKRFNQESEISVAVAVAVAEQAIVPDLKEKPQNIKPRRKRCANKKNKFEKSKTEEIAINDDLKEFSAREDDHRLVKTHQTITSSSETSNGSNQASEIVQRVAMLSVADDDRKAGEKRGKIEANVERSTKAVVIVNARPGSTRRRPPQRQTTEIEPRIDNRTTNNDDPKIRTNQRRSNSEAVMNSGRWDHRSSRKFGHRNESANLVWVRKEERLKTSQ